jgi:hypothetical protein
VATILGPAGFHFRWYPLAEAASAGSSVELAVVTFHGSCGIPDGPPYLPAQTQALGFTHITDGEILPFTTVDCERTKSFLAKAVAGLPQSERAEAFGRALGRILAHELYHIFANTQRHARNGVAKEAVTVADLMSENFSLEPREYERLRSGRAYSVLLNAGAL